jgi:Domain of unknown function (DUF4604)
MTFNAKNLHYEKQEPAFLRRLRNENTSDRHNVSIARPRKPRLQTGDDDGPTIVDEQGENLTEQEYQDLLEGKTKDESPPGKVSTIARHNPESGMKESLAVGTVNALKKRKEPRIAVNSGPKKRKQVKSVGAGSEIDSQPAEDGPSEPELNGEPRFKVKSKKRKIKLSFDEPET